MVDGYTRVKECPVCGKKNCLVSDDGRVAVCWRVAEGAHKQGDGGCWVHMLDGKTKPKGVKVAKVSAPRHDHDYWHRWIGNSRIRYADSQAKLGRELGLSEESLARLGVGVLGQTELREMKTACQGPYCWTFPMFNESRRPIGIRLRSRSGFKYACDGSRNGLFIPEHIERMPSELYICEGPTDTAAMLDLGYAAIGRPMNIGLEALIVKAVERIQPSWVTVMIDRDKAGTVSAGATWRGARDLSRALMERHIDNGIDRPPGNHKDVREYLLAKTSSDKG